MLVGVSIVQGGSGFPYFALSLYDYFCGASMNDIHCTLDEIPDPVIRTILYQVFT